MSVAPYLPPIQTLLFPVYKPGTQDGYRGSGESPQVIIFTQIGSGTWVLGPFQSTLHYAN